MRIGGYTLPQNPAPGWNPPQRLHRVSQVGTIGGARVSVLPGHISDEPLELHFDLLDATPAKTLIHSYADQVGDGASMTAGQRLAVPLPSWGSPPTEFSAASAARLRLRANPALEGYLTVEIWSTDPVERTGLLGVIEAADLDTTYQSLYRWSLAAWPIQDVVHKLVLNGDNMTAGTVYWAGGGATANGHLKYTTGWATATGELSHDLWQGGQHNVLRGLAGYQGTTPPIYEIDLANGNIYTGRIVRLESDILLMPQAYDDAGLARDTKATLLLETEA